MNGRLRFDAVRGAHAQATVRLQVPFHDVDAAGVVWHGHYVKYIEIARSALLDSIGFGHARMLASDHYWPVVSLTARYVQPLRLDQHFEVTAALVECDLRLRVRYALRALAHADEAQQLADVQDTPAAGDARGAKGVQGARGRHRIASAETIQVAVRRADGALCIGLPEEFRRCVPGACA